MTHEHETGHHHQVRIHIDREPYHSPNPTTGEALYTLGHIKPEHRLYREVQCDREDEPIERNVEPVHLKEDEHFYSEEIHHHHEYTIIVNAREKRVDKKKLSFEAIVALAFPESPPGDIIYTVAYRNGVHGQQGTMTAGHSVRIRNGMIFDVTATNRS